MKTPLCFALLLGLAGAVSAQYQINWFTLAGGGGRSSGGAYTLAATVAQPDAGTHAGGPYSHVGGFWSAFATLPTDGAPSLRIILKGPNVILAWPNPSTGYQLQETLSLTSPNWTDVGTGPDVVGNETQVSRTLAPGTRFYRLRKP